MVQDARREAWFQSSPALSGRCNPRLGPCVSAPPLGFQSSPALSGRCNTPVTLMPLAPGVSILTGPFGPVQRWSLAGSLEPSPPGFNPHRPFRAGATILTPAWLPSCRGFQSSPALSGRCNAQEAVEAEVVLQGVSILTGPFGPVQPGGAGSGDSGGNGVSILTGPFGPVQP